MTRTTTTLLCERLSIAKQRSRSTSSQHLSAVLVLCAAFTFSTVAAQAACTINSANDHICPAGEVRPSPAAPLPALPASPITTTPAPPPSFVEGDVIVIPGAAPVTVQTTPLTPEEEVARNEAMNFRLEELVAAMSKLSPFEQAAAQKIVENATAETLLDPSIPSFFQDGSNKYVLGELLPSLQYGTDGTPITQEKECLPGDSPVASPRIVREEVVASGLFVGDGGNPWGGHQPRITVHSDGTIRVVYLVGPRGPDRTWGLMRRSPAGGWSLEATGPTDKDVFLIRDPGTDTAHVVGFPDDRGAIFAYPDYAQTLVAGNWAPNGSTYGGVGISGGGLLVVRSYHDLVTGGVPTKDTQQQYVSGQFSGGSWSFSPLITEPIGNRHTYDYILPGGSSFLQISLKNLSKEVAGLPNLSSNYLWDGVRQFSFGATSAAGWSFADIIPRRTPPGGATEGAWVAIQDAFYDDSSGRALTLHYVADPNGPSGVYLTASNSAGAVLQQDRLGIPGGNPRIFADHQARLWLLRMSSPSGSAIYTLSDSLSMGGGTNLPFAHSYSGFGYIAAPRGGNARSACIDGWFMSGDSLVYYRVRLPD